MKQRRVVAAIVAGAGLGLTLMGSAHAEGSWSSNLSGALTGKQSRDWQDNNRDSTQTKTTFSGCSVETGTYRNSTLDLARHRTYPLPDATYGERTSNCGVHNWGRMTDVGSYHWTLKKINGSESGWRLNVSSISQVY